MKTFVISILALSLANCASSEQSQKANVGPADTDHVQEALVSHRDKWNGCYEAGLKNRKDKIAGRVTIAFTVGLDGRVKTAVVKEDHMPIPGVSDCILKNLKETQFPVSKAGLELQVEYPFVFAPKS